MLHKAAARVLPPHPETGRRHSPPESEATSSRATVLARFVSTVPASAPFMDCEIITRIKSPCPHQGAFSCLPPGSFFISSMFLYENLFLDIVHNRKQNTFTNSREPQRTRPTGQKLKGPAERDPTSTGCRTAASPWERESTRSTGKGWLRKGKLARHRRGTGRENGGVLRRHPMRGTWPAVGRKVAVDRP